MSDFPSSFKKSLALTVVSNLGLFEGETAASKVIAPEAIKISKTTLFLTLIAILLLSFYQINTAKQNSQSPCTFSCIQAAKDWLSYESWKNISKNVLEDAKNNSSQDSFLSESACKTGVVSGDRTLIQEINAGGWMGKNTVHVVIDEEKVDRKEKEYVREATEEACVVSASVLSRRFNKYVTRDSTDISGSKGGVNDTDHGILEPCKARGPGVGGGGGKVTISDELDASYVLEEQIQREAAMSARGVWAYTVGLVGKPSAGILFLMLLSLLVVDNTLQYEVLFHISYNVKKFLLYHFHRIIAMSLIYFERI